MSWLYYFKFFKTHVLSFVQLTASKDTYHVINAQRSMPCGQMPWGPLSLTSTLQTCGMFPRTPEHEDIYTRLESLIVKLMPEPDFCPCTWFKTEAPYWTGHSHQGLLCSKIMQISTESVSSADYLITVGSSVKPTSKQMYLSSPSMQFHYFWTFLLSLSGLTCLFFFIWFPSSCHPQHHPGLALSKETKQVSSTVEL